MKSKKIVLVGIILLVVLAGLAFFVTDNGGSDRRQSFSPPDSLPKKSSSEICLGNEEHAKIPSNAPKLSMPFYKDGLLPFTGDLFLSAHI